MTAGVLRPVGQVTGILKVACPRSVREGQDAADLWAAFSLVSSGREAAAGALMDGLDADALSVLETAGETIVRLARARGRGRR